MQTFRAATELETGTTTTIEHDTEHHLDEPGDHDRFAHYVPKSEITKAMVTGEPCTALCGKKWVPSRPRELSGLPRLQEDLRVAGQDGALASWHRSQATPRDSN